MRHVKAVLNNIGPFNLTAIEWMRNVLKIHIQHSTLLHHFAKHNKLASLNPNLDSVRKHY